jgi:hypothetical protein
MEANISCSTRGRTHARTHPSTRSAQPRGHTPLLHVGSGGRARAAQPQGGREARGRPAAWPPALIGARRLGFPRADHHTTTFHALPSRLPPHTSQTPPSRKHTHQPARPAGRPRRAVRRGGAPAPAAALKPPAGTPGCAWRQVALHARGPARRARRGTGGVLNKRRLHITSKEVQKEYEWKNNRAAAGHSSSSGSARAQRRSDDERRQRQRTFGRARGPEPGGRPLGGRRVERRFAGARARAAVGGRFWRAAACARRRARGGRGAQEGGGGARVRVCEGLRCASYGGDEGYLPARWGDA